MLYCQLTHCDGASRWQGMSSLCRGGSVVDASHGRALARAACGSANHSPPSHSSHPAADFLCLLRMLETGSPSRQRALASLRTQLLINCCRSPSITGHSGRRQQHRWRNLCCAWTAAGHIASSIVCLGQRQEHPREAGAAKCWHQLEPAERALATLA